MCSCTPCMDITSLPPATRTRLVHPRLSYVNVNPYVTYRYGMPFLVHTYFHHVTRIDHRHNFSVYNILLYLTSAIPSTSSFRIESVAFLPQILLSTALIPLVLAKKDLATSMMAQTFAFVTFNKVCTSQVCHFFFLVLFCPRPRIAANSHPVLPLVHDFPPTISSKLVFSSKPKAGRICTVSLGCVSGGVATTGIPARIHGRQHLLSGTVGLDRWVFPC